MRKGERNRDLIQLYRSLSAPLGERTCLSQITDSFEHVGYCQAGFTRLKLYWKSHVMRRLHCRGL